MVDVLKICSKCGVAKPLDAFGLTPEINRNKSGRVKKNANTTGRVAQCKKCRSDYSVQYAKKNKKKANSNAYAWAKRNPEKRAKIRSSQRKRFRATNRELMLERERAYILANLDAITARRRNWRSSNAGHIMEYRLSRLCLERAQARARYAKNPTRDYEKNKKAVDDLRDFYIANLIARGRFCTNDIPPDLIEAKRTHLKLVRKIKELKP